MKYWKTYWIFIFLCDFFVRFSPIVREFSLFGIIVRKFGSEFELKFFFIIENDSQKRLTNT